MARVRSVNVGGIREHLWHARTVTSGIWKSPVDGPVELRGVNLVGDDQADRRVHGGTDKAVYAYASEDYEWWAGELGGTIEPATFGENLTTVGIQLGDCCIGDRWSVGSAVLEVAQPRKPCFKLGMRMGDDEFPGRFERARRPGVYLRIVTPGAVSARDVIHVDLATPPSVPIHALLDDPLPGAVARFLSSDPRVPEVWAQFGRQRLLERG